MDITDLMMVKDTLAMRVYEEFCLSDEPFDESPYSYAVMMIDIPSFPGEMYPTTKDYTIIFLIRTSTYWRPVHVEMETRETIGIALEKINAERNKWYHLLLTRCEERE
jgi:hypothetical protein